MGKQNFVLIGLIATAGCTSTRTITSDGLRPLRHPVSGKAVLLDTPDGGRVRVDANSRVRFTLNGGQKTPWLKARNLRTGSQGLFVGGRVRLGVLDGLEASNLSGSDLASLGGDPTGAPGCRFFGDTAMGGVLRKLSNAERIPSGRWRARLPDGSWTTWMHGAALMQAHEHGLWLESGVLWSDITEAEVRNFSGGKTLGMIVVGTAVAATVVAIAVGSKHGPSGPKVRPASHHGVHHVAHSLHHGLHITAALLHTHEPLPTWRAPLPPAAPGVAQPSLYSSTSGSTTLFTGTTRRKATLQVVPSLQTLSTLDAPEGLEQSLALSLRLKEVWEFGGGLRAANLAAPKGEPVFRMIGFARAGLHLNLDDNHRVAVPLSIDIAAGQGVVMQARLNLGVRIRLTDKVALGLSAPSPTSSWMRLPNNKVVHRWSFPAGLELSMAL